MTVGIVGHEAAKFTKAGERQAREVIRRIIRKADKVVSGACHLGGIDVWAIEEAEAASIETEEFPPTELNWECGFKPRNLLIVEFSDAVHVIVVERLPPNFDGMTFDRCYHCDTSTHVKSGGCWTGKRAQKQKKPAYWHIVENR